MYVMRVIYSCANDPQGACSGSFSHTQTGRATLELQCKGSLERCIESQG